MSKQTLQEEAIDDLTNTAKSNEPTQSQQSQQDQLTPQNQQTPVDRGTDEEAYVTAESIGDPPVNNEDSEESGGHDEDEIENSGGESGQEEFETASLEQLTSKLSGKNAAGDLEELGEFDPLTLAEYSEAGEDDELELADVGSALVGPESFEAEEFGFLTSVIPALVSTVGPAIAKAVGRRVSKRTRRALRRHRATPIAKGRRRAGRRDRLLRLLSRLLESAENMPENAGKTNIDEALVEEIAGALEVIIGTDDRIRITATRKIPWRRICALRITFPSGRRFRGTGFFIGPRAVATAGHCVYMHSQGGWAKKIEVIPGANGSHRPFGTVTSRQFRSVRGWVTNRKPEYDYGCIIVPSGSFGGRNLGRFGFASLPASKLLARSTVLAGYPGDKRFAEMWGMARRIKTVTPERLLYDIDSMGGQSGAPLYIKHNGSRVVVGIHNYGHSSGNSATRVTLQVYRRLNRWSKI